MTRYVTCKRKYEKKRKKRKPYPVQDVTAYKAGQARELAERLLESPAELVDETTGEVNDHPARYFAALLMAEASGSNHVLADILAQTDDQDEQTVYRQGIPLKMHSLRIGPAYSQALRRRAHKVALSAILRAEDELNHRRTAKGISEAWGFKNKFNWSYRWVHGVGTMQHELGVEAWPEVQRINRVWELFRKRKIFTDNVIATIKGVEGRITPRGAHVHQHNMFLMRKVDLKKWEHNWQECGGGYFRLYTITGNVKDPENEQTQEEAIFELCKYITKTEDLLDPDPQTGEKVGWKVLLNLCLPARWPRMFEVLGTARAPGADAESPMDPQGEFSLARSASLRFIRPEYLTAAPLVEGLAEEWDEAVDGPEPHKWNYFGRQPEVRPPRPPTWRQLMAILPLDKWLDVIAARMARAQTWRLKQISARSIGPILDLDGHDRRIKVEISTSCLEK